MNKIILALGLWCGVATVGQAKTPRADWGIDVIPMPVKFELKGGSLDAAGVKPVCRRDKSVPAEGYRLSVTPDGVEIVSSSDAGEFYARQTLRQLPRAGRIPCCEIEDAPKYPYRGVMIDEGRHFFGKAAILKTLDLMAEYKLNFFHWHLTEDQGWRIEIKSHPELVRVGAKRPASPVRRSWDVLDGVPYGPFSYTQDEIREVVAYAKARHIVIYPEIDMPGHIRALLASHPELLCEGCKLDQPTPWPEWGISEDVLCLGNPATLALVKDILDEVCDLFPDAPYIHIGGDEAPVKHWASCPRCQALKRREGLVSDTALQGWFSRKVAEMLRAKGKRMAAWNSILGIGMDPPKDTMIACGCFAKSWDSTAKGYPTVMAPNEYSYFYFNQGLKDDPYDYGWFWSGTVSLTQVYSFSPRYYSSQEHIQNVIGGEAHLWSEYTLDAKDLDWKLWPRLFAMAEALWSEPEVGFAINDFVRRARLHREALIARGVNVARIEVSGLPYTDERAAETKRLQDEIDAASAKGGGRVVVTKGVHPCGTLRLKSGVELHLEEGAVLLGGGKSEDYEDFVFSDGFRPEINPPYSHKGFLVAEDAHDVAITGKGTVDASGTQFFDRSTTLWGHWWAKPACARPRLLKMHNCRRVRIEDVTFKDSPTWTIWLRRCEDVTVGRLKVVANDRIINSDGLDIDACRRVRVGDSQFDTGDDCVILRAMCRDGETAVCEDVVVSNCVLRSVCSGVRIGCPSDDLVRNAVFRDIAFEGRNAVVAQNPKRYLRPDCRAGNGGTLRTAGILFENWKAKCSGHPIEIAVEDGVGLSDFGHFTFRNFDVTAKEAIVIRGNAKSPVRDVRFESFRAKIDAPDPLVVAYVADCATEDSLLVEYPDEAECAMGVPELVNRPAEGFRGIWYYNQKLDSEYVYKYSGGMGTYCAGHIPMAVYAPQVGKTFFCFGGTTPCNTTLLQCVSFFDHRTKKLARPVVVYDKHTIDAHDNAVLNMDDRGYLFLFSSSHGNTRPSAIARSKRPYDISEWETIWTGNYSYPQPFFVPGQGFLFLHTCYHGRPSRRSNYFAWFDQKSGRMSEKQQLCFINNGNYLRSWQAADGRVGVSFDQHPTGKPGPGLNWRTDLFYVETRDGGKSWVNAAGEPVKLPITERENPALVFRYAEKGRNVYIKGVKFDRENRPIIVYVVSKGYASGPENGPRRWMIARFDGKAWREYDTGIVSDNNYDYSTLFVGEGDTLRLVGASETGPQPYNTGGEIAAWISKDGGRTWTKEKDLTRASVRNQNYPRQPLGGTDPGFLAFWADGNGRKPSISRLYFCDRDLNVYRMPLAVKEALVDPEPVTE